MAINFYPPQNTTDKLMDEMYDKRATQEKIMETVARIGYQEVQTPAFEYYDLFSPEYVSLGETDIFKLVDRDGKILALRPDLTTPIARLAATKLKNEPLPMRLCYCADVFRSAKDRPREFTQCGIELIGANSVQADAEVVIAAVDALCATGLTEFQIEIGQSEFIKGILEEINATQEETEEFKTLIDHKDSLGLSAFLTRLTISPEQKKLIERLPFLFGDAEVMEEIDPAALNPKSFAALCNLKEICALLREYGYDKYISIDLAMAQSINYYTGVIFRAFAQGAGFSVASGGRYDNLIANFGAPFPATGCAIDMDYLISVLRRQNASVKKVRNAWLVYSDDAYSADAFRAAQFLRERGFVAEAYLGGGSWEDCCSYAAVRKFTQLLHAVGNKSFEFTDCISGETRQIEWNDLTGEDIL